MALPPDSSYPRELSTFGRHLKRRRLDLGLYQREAAEKLGVCTHTVRNWEAGRSSPVITQWPAIIRLLGYDPHPAPRTIGERVYAARRRLGLTYRALAPMLGVDRDTVWGWETTAHGPRKPTRERIEDFLRTVPSVPYWRGGWVWLTST